MENRNEGFTGGFPDAVYNSQTVFRTLMDCMARPGSLGLVTPELMPPSSLGIAAGALMLTLCDHDTPVWLSQKLAQSSVSAWLAFHCGAPLTREKSEARFAFLEAGAHLPGIGLFALGTQEYPDRSTTLVIEIEAMEGGRPLNLTGPGIRDVTPITPRGLPADFLHQWTDNRALFPRGLDVVLTTSRQMIALPRTCKITALEV